ncbi:uncharacterized protein BDZ83DRAFT_649226 [Colletotrichum acutatum]|uniref:Uncharacterized protein n=1 Tax=Glomerella acutata TaxID=27357 RepID=A0AAD8UUD3_GLOAC|nr:uncharacterized protein BDZ83DRAFT_649226 [Colletotrichum acutatum]KAK1727864.1 hypothetical protein BDZ83DRAFT_649226 [Colletotrichum acutatum]
MHSALIPRCLSYLLFPQSNFSQKRRQISSLRDPLCKVRIAFWELLVDLRRSFTSLGLSTRTVPSLLVSSTAPDQTRIYLGLEAASPLPPSFFGLFLTDDYGRCRLRSQKKQQQQSSSSGSSKRAHLHLTVIAPLRSFPGYFGLDDASLDPEPGKLGLPDHLGN